MKSPRHLVQLLVVVACAAAALPGATASLMRGMDLSELTEGADQIVVGDVVSSKSEWDGQHRNIYSTIDISVQESWKGTPPSDGHIRIRQLGGTVGEIEMTVLGAAQFTPGERALLFLRQARVVGMGQGKRQVSWDSANKRWLARAPERFGAVLSGKASDAGASASEPSQAEPLERLRAKVRALLGN